MRVLFDDLGLREPYGGVSRYFIELASHLPLDIEPVFAVKETRNKYLLDRRFPRSRQTVHDFIDTYLGGHLFPGVSQLHRLLARAFPRHFSSDWLMNERYFNELIERGDIDIVHLTAPHEYGNAWRKLVGSIPFVITVHDLIKPIMPRGIVKAAAHIIAVSQATKDDLIMQYGIPENKVSVIYHGYTPPSECARAPIVEGGYVLFVGKKDGYKNFAWMEQALAPILQEKGLSLVCTDGKYSDDELRSLYQHASAFIFPSRQEGFGLPILEAFANKCPVLLSDIPVFHEVAGDAANYFKLDDEADFKIKLLATLDNKALIDHGSSRLSMFSWQTCTAQTVEVYKRI